MNRMGGGAAMVSRGRGSGVVLYVRTGGRHDYGIGERVKGYRALGGRNLVCGRGGLGRG